MTLSSRHPQPFSSQREFLSHLNVHLLQSQAPTNHCYVALRMSFEDHDDVVIANPGAFPACATGSQSPLEALLSGWKSNLSWFPFIPSKDFLCLFCRFLFSASSLNVKA